MSHLNIFNDGTWLLNQLAAGGSFANATETPDRRFPFDFSKLNGALVEHVKANGHPCAGVADCFISTSIFSLPTDFDAWPSQFEDITTDQIEKTRRAVAAREALVSSAAEAGYRQDAVFRPPIRDWVIRRLAEQKYRERQVDTSVVALLVRSAVTKPRDFHALITGDSDMLPAIQVAYPHRSSCRTRRTRFA